MPEFAINDSDTDIDSEEELQEAYATGLLQPGLNEVIEKTQKNHVNNTKDLKTKLKEIKLNLPWIETLELVTTVAPMAPDIALQLQETAIRRKNLRENTKGKQIYDPAQDPVLNEFKRENLIHRQAQAAVLEGIKKLKELNIPIRRPDDYFAEMAKTDDHMQKVRKNLMAKQAAQERTEKVRQLRDQKKIAKRVQIDTKLKQAAEKKQMLDQLKRVRKGKLNDLNFLDDNKTKNTGKDKSTNKADKIINKKRAMKDKKFGFGGKKKGSKLNTRESSNQLDEFNSSSKRPKFNFKNKHGAKPGGARIGPKKKQRPGKSKRRNNKR